jgi:hypothetical protein
LEVEKGEEVPAECADTILHKIIENVPNLLKYFILLFMILLVYNSCTKGYIGIFTYIYIWYLSWIYPLHQFSLSLPSKNNFNRFHSFIFIYGYKIYPPYSPSFPLSLCLPLPLVSTPRKDLYFPPALHFFFIKCILIVQGGFFLVLQVCIYSALTVYSPPHIIYSFYHYGL